MLIELVDDLRCPRPHEETWLVAATNRTEGRSIIEGTLGCPICGAEYPIREGVVWFETPEQVHDPAADRNGPADQESAMRLAALLDLSDAQGFALLAGSWGTVAPFLQGIVPTQLVLLNPRPPIAVRHGMSVLEIATGIPLADATCRGIAMDYAHADAAHLDAAVRVLRLRGRLVAPASTPTPGGVMEIARDEALWVGERAAVASTLVSLQRRADKV